MSKRDGQCHTQHLGLYESYHSPRLLFSFRSFWSRLLSRSACSHFLLSVLLLTILVVEREHFPECFPSLPALVCSSEWELARFSHSLSSEASSFSSGSCFRWPHCCGSTRHETRFMRKRFIREWKLAYLESGIIERIRRLIPVLRFRDVFASREGAKHSLSLFEI